MDAPNPDSRFDHINVTSLDQHFGFNLVKGEFFKHCTNSDCSDDFLLDCLLHCKCNTRIDHCCSNSRVLENKQSEAVEVIFNRRPNLCIFVGEFCFRKQAHYLHVYPRKFVELEGGSNVEVTLWRLVRFPSRGFRTSSHKHLSHVAPAVSNFERLHSVKRHVQMDCGSNVIAEAGVGFITCCDLNTMYRGFWTSSCLRGLIESLFSSAYMLLLEHESRHACTCLLLFVVN